jgi:YHS domain-containing protein
MKTKSILSAIALLVSPSIFAAETSKKEEVKPYKPDTCIVSDEKLGEMGKPYVFVHEGREIKLCCKSCLKKFDKEPAKYLKKLEEKE